MESVESVESVAFLLIVPIRFESGCKQLGSASNCTPKQPGR